MTSAHDIAKYILTVYAAPADEPVTNLKLQKLLYYAQGLSLAIFDEPLFKEEIRAWSLGPVVAEVYHTYKPCGSLPIPLDGEYDGTDLTAQQREVLAETWEVYGQFAAWRLVNMTHEEAPWKATPVNEVISLESMKDFFKGQLVSG